MSKDRSLDEESIPDLNGPLPEKGLTGDPQEGTSPPADHPSSLDWATTGAEQQESEPRSAKLARELPDVIATVPDDSDLVELIETGDSEDDAELLAETVDGDGMELSPEEAALHIV